MLDVTFSSFFSVAFVINESFGPGAGGTVGDCPMPKHPAHGRHQPQGGDCGGANRHPACDGTPGTLAPEDWLLTVRCDPGYQPLNPEAADAHSVCLKGVWSIPELPKCIIPGW